MTSYKAQIDATKAAHLAARALADAAQISISAAFDRYNAGEITSKQYEAEALRVVRKSYRDSAKVARLLTKSQAQLTGWNPEPSIITSPYLKSLEQDVRNNFKKYREGIHSDRQLRLRLQLSAYTGAERGFTDAQLKHYKELQDFGYRIRKLWVANFMNNDPCIDCVNLHGTAVAFESEFPVPTLMRTAIYRDLQGPPLHVRCKCVMVVLISSLDNIFESIPNQRTTSRATAMTTESVKRLPTRAFNSILSVLSSIARRGKND